MIAKLVPKTVKNKLKTAIQNSDEMPFYKKLSNEKRKVSMEKDDTTGPSKKLSADTPGPSKKIAEDSPLSSEKTPDDTPGPSKYPVFSLSKSKRPQGLDSLCGLQDLDA